MRKFFCAAVLLSIVLMFGDKILLSIPAPSEKLWAHRCDSLEKFRLMSNKYAGLEIDATFYPDEPRGSRFDVSHDKKKAVEYPLESFMAEIAAIDNPIWFDFKNLTAENASAALEELDGLLEQYGVDRGRFIVESHAYEQLGAFRAREYYTAYEVPVHASAYGDEIVRDENFLFANPGMVEYFCRLVREAAASGNIDAVTFPLTYYRLVKHADVPAELLTWDTHGERWWHFFIRKELRAMLFDEQVRAILVDTPTEFDR